MKNVKITALKIGENKSSLTYKVNGIQVKDEIDWFDTTEAKRIHLFEPNTENEHSFRGRDGNIEFEGDSVWRTYEDLTKPEVLQLLEWSFENHKEFFGYETVEDMIDEFHIDYENAKSSRLIAEKTYGKLVKTLKSIWL